MGSGGGGGGGSGEGAAEKLPIMRAADVILCSHSKLCPNYILPKAIIQPRFTSANWIFLF